MKKAIKMFLCILVVLFLNNKVQAKVFRTTDCEYTDQYENWLLLTDEEKSKVIQPPKCKNTGPFYIKPKFLGDSNLELQSSFDLRTNDNDTGPRSQEDLSTCWAFADLNSVETNLLVNGIKNGTQKFIFSPAHAELTTQNELYDTPVLPIVRDFDSGGYYGLSAAYFFDRIGPVFENDVPFSTIYNIVHNNATPSKENDIGNYKAVVSVNDSVEYSADFGPCTTETINAIKKYVTTNGGLVTMMVSDDANYAESNPIRQYYFSSIIQGGNIENAYNHEATIIGWDDDIPKTNFRSKTGEVPSRNGAWLIKNSNNYTENELYQSLLGNGYNYVSYDDPFVCTKLVGFYNVSTDLDDNVYVHDVLGFDVNYPLESSVTDIYLANKFDKKSTNAEKLNKVTFYSYRAGQNFEVFYSSDGVLNNIESLYTGQTNKIGYTTIDLSNKNIRITSPSFAIAIRYTKNLDYIDVPAYIQVSDTVFADYAVEKGKSYFSFNGTRWNDLEFQSLDNPDENNLAYASIKAYTDNIESTTNIFNIEYVTSENITSIGKTSDTCSTESDSCSVTLPTITPKNGYRVLGWFSSINDDTPVGEAGESYNLTGNITLYAKVESINTTYTVTLHYDNGAIAPENTTLTCTTYGDEETCQVTLPTINVKDDYNVLGWFNANNGGNRVDESSVTIDVGNNLHLYARTSLKPKTYTATFSPSDGVASVNPTEATCTTEAGNSKCSITLPEITPEDGYTISGWYDNNDELVGGPGDNYQLSKDVTLYAKGELEVTAYTAVFRTTDGIYSIAKTSLSCNLEANASKCSIILPKITPKNGYTVLGWYTADTGGEKVGNPDATYELSRNITLYARATSNGNTNENNETTYTVTLRTADNHAKISKNTLTCTTTTNSCKVTLPQIEPNDGYSVSGWYTAITGGSKVGNIDDEYNVTGDVTIYARVIKNPVNDPSVTNDDTFVVDKNPNNSDYTGSNVTSNPQTGNKKLIIILIVIMAIMGGIYYNNQLKYSKNY